MPAVPNNLALENIANGAEIKAQPLRDNYADIQAEFNKVVEILDGGSAGQFLKNLGAGSADWGDVGATSLVTALPGSPTDGQEIVLVDSLTAPTYHWSLRYIGAKATNKWVVIGGTDVLLEVAAGESTGSTSYTDLTTAGPTFTAPVAGEYQVQVGFESSVGGGTAGAHYMSYSVAGAGASDNNAAIGQTPAPTPAVNRLSPPKRHQLASTQTFVSKYRVGSGVSAHTFGRRWMLVRPVALGG